MSTKKQNDFVKNTLRFLSLIIIQGIAAAAWLLLIPKEAGNAEFLGYSFRRLALLVPILGLAGVAGIGQIALRKRTAWMECIADEKCRTKFARPAVVLGFLMAFLSWSFAFFFHFMRFFEDIGAYIRLLPIVVYVFLVGLEIILFVILSWLGGRENKNRLILKALSGKAVWIALAVLFAGWVLVEITGLGKKPEFVSISSLGVPLLEGQIWYMVGLVVLILCLLNAWSRLPGKDGSKRKLDPDLLVCVALWALALLLWMSLPLPRHNYFAPRALPPNYSIYPFSDAEQYDMNSLWVWKGSIKDTVISKPLYVVFLSILHALVGLDYGKVILLQTLVLALLPAIIYLVGKEMHSRLGGLVLALFVILREMNSIQAVNIANVSNSKLLLSDTPATLLVALLVLVMIRWFKSPEKKVGGYPFLVGGLVACLNLTRIQTLLIEPFILLLLVFRYKKQFKKMLKAFLFMLVALALVLSPVLIRNHSITGVYWLDNPATSSALYRFFIDASDYEVDIPEAETEEDMLNRNITVISQVISQNLGNVLLSMGDNFLHNVISTLLIFPIRLGNQIEFLSFLRIDEPFWSDVYSRSNLLNALVGLLNLLIIANGVGSVVKKYVPSIWLVLAFYGIYNLSSTLVRLSGWRFIQPVDWLSIAFFTFGLLDLLRWGMSRLIGPNGFAGSDPSMEFQTEITPRLVSWKPLAAFGALFLLTGAFIPLREILFPVSYPYADKEEVCTIIDNAMVGSEWEDQREALGQLCRQDNVLAFEGIGIFPRYFKADEGFYKRNYDPFYGEQPYGRLVFRTIGEPNSKVYIKTDDESIHFPDGAEVYVIGEDQRKFEAQAVLIVGEENQLIVSMPEEQD